VRIFSSLYFSDRAILLVKRLIFYNINSGRQQLNNDENANFYKREFDADQDVEESREFVADQEKRAYNPKNVNYEDNGDYNEKY
jgi:hypothetical protein